jgi:hypothetical protein
MAYVFVRDRGNVTEKNSRKRGNQGTRRKKKHPCGRPSSRISHHRIANFFRHGTEVATAVAAGSGSGVIFPAGEEREGGREMRTATGK